MTQRFGTDGIRGVANASLSPEFAVRLGRAVAQALGDIENTEPILIARDTRCSGPMLEGAFVAGVLSTGRDVRCIGITPTPALAFVTRLSRARAGVMISASHNPIEDNGFKLFDRDGMKLPDAMERTIEFALARDDEAARPTHAAIGRQDHAPELVEQYITAVVRDALPLEGLRVIVDAAYGAAWECAPRILEMLGAEVMPLHCEPDGTRINVHCGATDMHALELAVKNSGQIGKSAIGIAFDGDADRVRFVDEAGESVDGDAIMLMLARDLYTRGVLTGDIVVGTVMSNLAFEHELERTGIRLLRTPVGDRHVLERLKMEGAIFGGEPSGHIIDLRRNVTGDGPATALAVLGILRRDGRELREISAAYTPFPQELINIRIASQVDIIDHPTISDAQQKAVVRLGRAGRLLIRASGTEPLVRVMVEGEDPQLVREIASSLAQVVREIANSGA